MSDEELDCYLSGVSETFSVYMNIYSAFEFFINTTPEDLKAEFARDVIRRMFSTRTPSGDYPYGRSFADGQKHTARSFDMFFDFHRSRIVSIFFNNCRIIYRNLVADVAAYESCRCPSLMSGHQLSESRNRRRQDNRKISAYPFLNRYLMPSKKT